MDEVIPTHDRQRRWTLHRSMPSSMLVVSDTSGTRIETADTRFVCTFAEAIARGWVVPFRPTGP